jgi:hypothetical protein
MVSDDIILYAAGGIAIYFLVNKITSPITNITDAITKPLPSLVDNTAENIKKAQDAYTDAMIKNGNDWNNLLISTRKKLEESSQSALNNFSSAIATMKETALKTINLPSQALTTITTPIVDSISDYSKNLALDVVNQYLESPAAQAIVNAPVVSSSSSSSPITSSSPALSASYFAPITVSTPAKSSSSLNFSPVKEPNASVDYSTTVGQAKAAVMKLGIVI